MSVLPKYRMFIGGEWVAAEASVWISTAESVANPFVMR